MSYLDLFLILPIAWGAYAGYKNGFIYEICLLMTMVLGLIGAAKFSGIAAQYLSEKTDWSPQVIPFVSFIAVFLIIIVGVIFFARILSVAINKTPLGIANNLLGLVAGATKWALFVSLLFYFISPFENKFNLLPENVKKNSVILDPLTDFSGVIAPKILEYRKLFFNFRG